MKVTALIPDQLVKEVKHLSRGDEWISIKKIQTLNKKIAQKPLRFRQGYSAASIRKLNRKRS